MKAIEIMKVIRHSLSMQPLVWAPYSMHVDALCPGLFVRDPDLSVFNAEPRSSQAQRDSQAGNSPKATVQRMRHI